MGSNLRSADQCKSGNNQLVNVPNFARFGCWGAYSASGATGKGGTGGNGTDVTGTAADGVVSRCNF